MKKLMVNPEEYTSIQTHIMSQYGHKDKFAVIGGPGTGKTILALEGLNKILSEEAANNVAFVVFNRALKAFLERYLAYAGREDVIYTWHSFLPRFLMATFNIDFEMFKERYQKSSYVYDLDKIEVDLSEVRTHKKYYYMFIDEAQDFPEPVLRILDKISIRLYVFFDDNQKFTPEMLDDKIAFSDIEQSNILNILNLEEDFYDLTTNFRNTKEIEAVAKIYDFNYMVNNITLRRSTVQKSGPKPKLMAVSEPERLVDLVISEHLKNPNKSIGLLVSKMKHHKRVLDQYRDLFLKDERLNTDNFYVHSRENESALNDAGIFLMTYQISKGLEFDHVYLLELNNEHFCFDYYHKNAFYVSITRAKQSLTFVYDDALASSKVIALAKKHPNLFDSVRLKAGEEND